jgi:AcrR family transcriptional regulator
MPASDDRTYPSVWARPPRRKERSTLTREQIVRQALELLDAEGIEALSMRKLAARLESGTTSLYWHVANRDELIELVVNEVYGEIEVPDTDDWQEATRAFAQNLRAGVHRHPWTAAVLEHLVAAYPGPNLNALTERMLAVLEAAGFDLREAERALSALSAYVAGMAMSEAAWHTWIARRGLTPQEWADQLVGDAEQATEGHERLQAVVASYQGEDPEQAVDDDFAYGLDRFLDGLQSRLG